MVEVKTSKDFSELIAKLNPTNEEHKIALEKIIKDYPYFQTPFLYYSKLLKNTNHYDYEKILNQTAVLTNDRKVLKIFIDNFRFNQVSKGAKKIEPQTNKSKLKLSFIEWIKYSEKKSDPTIDGKIPLENKIDIIDDFIDKSPSIPRIDKNDETSNLELENVFSPEELMTETLAKVFLKQKKYGKALKAYRILSLKYPEKNAFFAVQIKKIKEIQDKE